MRSPSTATRATCSRSRSAPPRFTTDQNTPDHLPADVQTSLADTYNLTANAPPGWTVTIDATGNVTATPAPGLQSGTYPIQIIAQSQTDPNLEAQTTVEVTITPTQPGINFTVAPDTQFTVPFNGAQLPTAFRATIQNLGPAADTYNLTFSNVPSGFTLLEQRDQRHGPGGQTGILGLYLHAEHRPAIPAAGDPAVVHRHRDQHHRSVDHPDADRDVHRPGDRRRHGRGEPDDREHDARSPVTDTITLTNVGNVPENNSRSPRHATTGLTVSRPRLRSSLMPGQSTTETITLTPDASTPLNSMLQATLTATFGPSASPLTQTLEIPVSRRPRRRRDRQRGGRGQPARQHRPGQPSERPQHGADQPGPEPDQCRRTRAR